VFSCIPKCSRILQSYTIDMPPAYRLNAPAQVQILSSRPEKVIEIDRFLSIFRRYKSIQDFRYVPFELDMPDGSICCLTATRFISYRVLSETKNISILRSKNIKQTKFAYRLFRICAYVDRLKSLISRHW